MLKPNTVPFGCCCCFAFILTIWLFANFWVPSPPPPSLCTLRPHLHIFICICNHWSWKEPSIFKTFPNKSVQFCTSKSFLFQKQVSNRRRYLSGKSIHSHLVEQSGVEHEMGLFVWMGGGTEQIAKKKWTLCCFENLAKHTFAFGM